MSQTPQLMSPSSLTLFKANGQANVAAAKAHRLAFRTQFSMPKGVYVPAAVSRMAAKTPTAHQLALRAKAGLGRK